MLSINSDVGGNRDAFEISPNQPRTPPLLLPSCHNPHMCGDATSAIRQCSTTFTRRTITKRGSVSISLLSYIGIGLLAGPETTLAPLLSLDLICRSLIQARMMITTSQLFPPGSMQQMEGLGPVVRPRRNPGSEKSVCCCCCHRF